MAIVTDGAAETHTLRDFIEYKTQDNYTYTNYSILEKSHGITLLDHNLFMDYIEEAKTLCMDVELTDDEYVRYKYSPDLLSYHVYGTTQLDFVILYVNNIIDPKDFTFYVLSMIPATSLKSLLNSIYNANMDYVQITRDNNDIPVYI